MPAIQPGLPTLKNTGVPRGVPLVTYNDDLRTSQVRPNAAGHRVLTRVNVRGTIHVDTPNTIIKCSEVDTKIEIGSGVKGTRIWNVKIGEPGTSIGGDEGIGDHDFVARRVQIAGTTDGIRVAGGTAVLQDSLLYSPFDDGKPHADGAHISTGAGKVLISDNRIHWTATGGDTATSNIMMFQEDAPVWVMRNCLTGDTHSRINKVKVGSHTVIKDNTC